MDASGGDVPGIAIAAGALESTEISVVPRSRETVLSAGAIESAVGVIERTQTIAARALECSKISIGALESRDTIAAVESSRRELALIERRDISTRTEIGALIPQSRERAHRPRAHR